MCPRRSTDGRVQGDLGIPPAQVWAGPRSRLTEPYRRSAGKFASRVDGHRAARRVWACLDCPQTWASKPEAKRCECGGAIQHFASRAEHARFAALRLQAQAGLIEGLVCQPSYPLVVRPIAGGEPLKVGTYRADFRYMRGGELVVEDVKGTLKHSALDPSTLLRIRLAEALYGITVRLVRA